VVVVVVVVVVVAAAATTIVVFFGVQTVNHCKSLIEKDDATRKELGLEILSFSELRQYKKIRDAINEDAIWLPGKRMTGGMDRRSFVDEDEEDERYDPPLILSSHCCRVGRRCHQLNILPVVTSCYLSFSHIHC